MLRMLYLVGWGWVLIASALVFRATRPDPHPPGVPIVRLPGGPPGTGAARWFAAAKPYCNPLEAEVHLVSRPAPAGWDGEGYHAACLAIAGRTDRARELLDALPAEDAERAAGIVFEVGHPIADAGDDRSAGPIMRLVAEYQPWNCMALYHAGMSFYATGDHEQSARHLRRFLELYDVADGWRAHANEVLGRLNER